MLLIFPGRKMWSILLTLVARFSQSFDLMKLTVRYLFFLFQLTSHCFCFWTSRNKTTRKCNLRSSQQQKQWWWRWWQEVVNKLDNSLKKKKAHQLFWSSQLCSTWKSAGSSSSTVRSPQLLLLLLLFKIILTSSVGWTENFRQTI